MQIECNQVTLEFAEMQFIFCKDRKKLQISGLECFVFSKYFIYLHRLLY